MAKGKLHKQFLSGPQEVPRRKQVCLSFFSWLWLVENSCVVVEVCLVMFSCVFAV